MKSTMILLVCLGLTMSITRRNKRQNIKYKDYSYTPCQLRDGVLGVVEEYTHSKNEQDMGMDYVIGIKTAPKRVELTPRSMVIKRNVIPMDPYKVIDLKQISKINIPQLWMDHSVRFKCFQLITDQWAGLQEVTIEHSEEPIQISEVTINLCCQTEKQRREWVESIVAMKECTRLQRKQRHEEYMSEKRRRMKQKQDQDQKSKSVDELQNDLQTLRERTIRLKAQLKRKQDQSNHNQMKHEEKEEVLNEIIDKIHPQYNEWKTIQERKKQIEEIGQSILLMLQMLDEDDKKRMKSNKIQLKKQSDQSYDSIDRQQDSLMDALKNENDQLGGDDDSSLNTKERNKIKEYVAVLQEKKARLESQTRHRFQKKRVSQQKLFKIAQIIKNLMV